jgi:gluconolactonase
MPLTEDVRTLDFEVVAEGLAFPEGPVVFDDGSVLVVEVVGGTLKRIWGDGRVELVSTPGGGPNGAQIGPDGAVYICNNGGLDMRNHCNAVGPGSEGRIERIDLATGRVERVHDHCNGRPLSAPNDLVFDRTGGLWFTDFGKILPDAKVYSSILYSAPGHGSISAGHTGAVAYNGIGLSPDETRLYVSDTRLAKLFAFDLEAPGVVGPPRDPAVVQKQERRSRRTVVGVAPGDVAVDSLAVTARGAVCVATLVRGGISCFGEDGYEYYVDLPDHTVTNIAFGGPDMRTAYITCSGTGKLLRTRWPEPGLRHNFAI